ncbi:MAG: hypothetical protein OEW93_01855 [Candidatus Bathyarchaeota archaeon]|nr:hypothetical protein [Candidatus Bathyarchaeota archaeon]
MPFTVVGWFENQDSAALINVLALADPHVRVVGDDIIVPAWAKNLVGIYAYGVDLTLARLVSPSLRRLANPDISPLDKADEPTSNPPFHDFFDTPIPLEVSEALNFQGAEDNAAAGDMAAFAWLGSEITPAPAGQIFTVRSTQTVVALTVDVWNNRAFTLDQTLPAGRYACVGARAQAAGLRAFRFLPVGETHRPGALGFDADGDIAPARFRNGKVGVWFEFEHNAPPTVDLMSLSADTAVNIWLDLVQTRAGPA